MEYGNPFPNVEKLANINFASVRPFGRVGAVRKDLLDADLTEKYWKWTEEQIAPYL